MSRKILYTLFFFTLGFFLLNTYCFCQSYSSSWYNEEFYLKNSRKLTNFKIAEVNSQTFTIYRGGIFEKSYVIESLLLGDTTNVTITKEYFLENQLEINVNREEILGVKAKSRDIARTWGIVGFGCGHYYAGDPSTGSVLQFIDDFACALTLLGPLITLENKGNPTVFIIGFSTLIGTRIFGAIDSPKAVERYNDRIQYIYKLPLMP